MGLNRQDEFAALCGQAVEHHLQGRLAEALALYDAATRLNPTAAAAHGNPDVAKPSPGRTGGAPLRL
jgi:hypothetical protein